MFSQIWNYVALLAIILLQISSCRGFLTTTVATNQRQVSAASSSCRWTVKKKQKKKKATNQKSSGVGFGVVKQETTDDSVKIHDDYAVFPALEKNVQDTLVPAREEDQTMDGEIYQRLDQIYGFPRFNYEDAPEVDFGDLLSVNADDETESSSDVVDTSSIADSLDQLAPFDSIRVLHIDPLVLAVDDFFTTEECDAYIAASRRKGVLRSRSPTVGKDAAAQAQRTSTTFYHMFEKVPELMSKAARLFGVDSITNFEEPQTVCYKRNEKFTWHLDAIGPAEQEQTTSGQRVSTLLVYLTDMDAKDGGATLFRDLGGSEQYLRVQPRKGTALVFFPAAGAIDATPFDIRTLHCGQVVAEEAASDKWIAQLWLRQYPYQPTAPAGNSHQNATTAIREFCRNNAV